LHDLDCSKLQTNTIQQENGKLSGSEIGISVFKSQGGSYMAKHSRLLQSSKGFTLIELMIVVAIIGILAAIAIPNFMTYQAKARQSEAKVGLGGIFTTAVSYFAENGTYNPPNGGAGLGYQPAGNPRYAFYYGTPATMLNVGQQVALQFQTPPCFTILQNPTAAVAATAAGFTAGARGNVDSDDTCDEWTINDIRDLKNQINDVAS
jgi:type IV pilus assembly protein PilA